MDNVSLSLVDYIGKLKSAGANDRDIKKSFNRYLDIYARKNKIPYYGKFELTPLCNLDCKMCYVHLASNVFHKEDLLPVSVWKQLMRAAHDAGMMNAMLTGGECLTYPGFDELFLFLRSIGVVPGIMSNGLLIDSDRIDFFKKYPPSLIQVTLYGSSDDVYEKVTGHRAFQAIYRNLELLRDTHLRVTLAITPSLFMKDDIRSLVKVAQSLGIPYGINANLISPRIETGRKLADLDIDSYIEVYKAWKEMNQEDLAPIDPIELPDESKKGKETFGLVCGAGRSAFDIQYNGKMSPCPSLGEVVTEPLKEGFLPAWKRLNYLVENYPMPMECPECVYHDYCLNCPAIHNNANNPGHRDPRICERTKRLIQEGFMEPPKKVERSS